MVNWGTIADDKNLEWSVMPTRTLQLALCLLALFTFGCGGSGAPPTAVSLAAGFHLDLPKDYHLDEAVNPNTEATTTWFRSDGRSLLAVDVQPLAGSRKKTLLKLGKRGYLAHVAEELEKDLGNHLKVFDNYDWQLTELAGEPVLEAVFETDHQGLHQQAYLMMAVAGGESPIEVLVDYRLPEDEANEDKVWLPLLESVRWESPEEGHEKDKAEAHGEEAKAEEHGKEEKASSGH